MTRLTMACLVAVAASCGQCFGAVIDFEDHVVPPGFITTGDLVSGGFSFDTPQDHSHLHISGDADVLTENGTNYYATDDFLGTNPLTLSKVGGGLFTLNQLDFAEYLQNNRVSTLLSITGNVFGGGTVVQNVNLDFVRDGLGGLNDFQTTTFDGTWTSLTSVVFKGSGSDSGEDYFALDNIHVDEVTATPEPVSMALLGLTSLGGIGLRLRRNRKTLAA